MVLKGKLVGKGLDWPSEWDFFRGREGGREEEEEGEVEADLLFCVFVLTDRLMEDQYYFTAGNIVSRVWLQGHRLWRSRGEGFQGRAGGKIERVEFSPLLISRSLPLLFSRFVRLRKGSDVILCFLYRVE